MNYPIVRSRRLRQNGILRDLVRENNITVHDLVYPLFIKESGTEAQEIQSMPGVFQHTVDSVQKEIENLLKLGIKAVILFGIPEHKDESGSGAYYHEGIIQRTIRQIKKYYPELLIIADTCLCEYTSHGHCGLLKGQCVDNDSTLKVLAETAVSQAEAGADIVAPSAMMDGQVQAIRTALDRQGSNHIPIMSYAAKYASSYYTPFREAAEGAPQFGDRKQYQMDAGNAKEATKEVLQDIQEGADIVMVKPALAYLDIVREIRDILCIPLAVYNVSGEYSMVKAAVSKGWLDERTVVTENMVGFKRAGADIIITYHAKDVASWLC